MLREKRNCRNAKAGVNKSNERQTTQRNVGAVKQTRVAVMLTNAILL